MDSNERSSLYRTGLIVMLALTVFSCSGGGGCSSCTGCGIQPIPGAYPLEHRIDNAAQVRLSSSGIDFIESNIGGIVSTFVPGGLDFPIPRTTQSVGIGDVTICPDSNCNAHIEIDSLEIDPQDPNQLLAHVRLILDSRDAAGDRAPIPVDVPGYTCQLDIDTRRPSRAYVGVVAALAFANTTQPARQGYTHVEIQSVELADGEDIENDDLDISAPCSGLDCINPARALCGIANLGFVKGFIIDQLTDQISSLASSALGDQLCQKRGEFGCPTGTFSVPDENPDSTCRFENNADAECVPILLGTDGRGDLGGTLLGGFSPGTHAYAQFLLASGGEGEAVNEGMSLFFYGGFMGTDRTFTTTPAHNSCVPMVDPPMLPDIDRAAAFRGNVIPGTSTETHLGIGIAEDYLDYAGYGMFDSGMLCLGAGTRLSQQLSTGLVSAAIMSLPDLTFPDGASALTIAVRPQTPPDVSIGEGTDDDPLIQIQLNTLQMDFYVWSTERYVRFMTFQTDLTIGVNLAVEGNQLVPMIPNVSATNSSVMNSDLLAERPEQLAAVLESVISGFAGMLTSGISPFDLPSVMGFDLQVPDGGVTRVVDTEHGNRNFLGIFANLALSSGAPLTAPVETSLEISDVSLDPESMDPAHWNEGEGNSAWLSLRAQGPNGVDYEYSYRIDGGPWSAWTTSSRIYVEDDILLLQARHEIEARARVAGEPDSVDATPAHADLVVDILPPNVQVARTADGVRVEATDIVSERDRLEVRFQIDGAWTDWSHDFARALPYDGNDVLVEVRDEAGNVGSAQAALIRGLPDPSHTSGCGCSVPGHEGGLPLSLLGLLGALGVVFVRGRRAHTRAALSGSAPASERRGAYSRYVTGPSADVSPDQSRLGSRRSRAPRQRRRRGGRLASFLSGTVLLGGAVALSFLAAGCECGEPMNPNPCEGECHAARPPGNTSGDVCCEATDMCVDYDLTELCDPGYECDPDDVVADASCGVSCSNCTLRPALPEGILATHLDTVLDPAGTVHISGYSPGNASGATSIQYGDLVFGTWNGSAVDWEIVDGAPSMPITNDPNGWRGGVSDPGDDVGRWTSIAMQGDTYLISYYDKTNGALKLAAGGPDAWQTHVVDDTGDSGRYSSLVVTPAGIPTIAYLRIRESPDTPGQVVGSVMVATANLANPSSSSDWTITEVASGPMPCRAELCESAPACLASGQCVTPTSDCGAACGSDQVCFNGTCEDSIGEGYVEDMPPAYGLYTSLAVDPTGGLALVYYDRTAGNIYGVRYDGAAWGTPFLIDGYGRPDDPDDPADPSGDSGEAADVTVDSSGLWHVAFVDGTEETLRYAQVEADGNVLVREVVDDGSTDGTTPNGDGRHIVGDDASIVVLEGGAVRIAYQDSTVQHAVVAVRGAGGGWALSHVDTDGSTGYWVDQQLLGTTSYLTCWWRKREMRDSSNGIHVLTAM